MNTETASIESRAGLGAGVLGVVYQALLGL